MARQNSDDSNLPLRTLAVLAIIAAAVGIIFLLVGSRLYGGVFLGFGFQTWILLMIFWAWRHERRTVPAATTYKVPTADELAAAISRAMTPASKQPAAPAGQAPNRMQREAAARAAAARAGQASAMRWSEE